MATFGKEWEGYVPPTDRGVGEAALPTGVRRRPPEPPPAADGAAPAARDGGGHRPFRGREKGEARITRKIVYVDLEQLTLVPAKDAKALGLDKQKGRWQRFDSAREGKRFIYLTNRQRCGLIRGLRCQVRFPLNVLRPDKLQETIATWTCDFEYERLLGEPREGRWERVIEDCKGHRTEMYLRSKKHFEAQYGVKITES